MTVALIPCATTEWIETGRLLGRVELSPARRRRGRVRRLGRGTLADLRLKQIYHAPDELATRAARWLGRKLVVPTKSVDALAEVDVGLWSGLTEAELKARYASAHRQLRESPLSVSPPGGESLGDADARLRAFLKKQVRPNGKTPLGFVMRPVSFSLARCALEGRDPTDVWEYRPPGARADHHRTRGRPALRRHPAGTPDETP